MSEKFVLNYLESEALKAGLSTDIDSLTSRELAEVLNREDKLKHLRDEFCFPKKGTIPEADPKLIDPNEDSIYLCGNSLGLMPKATREITNEQFDKWAKTGVFGHTHGPVPWALGDEECLEGTKRLVGASDIIEVGMMNGLTVNVHVLLTAFYNPTEERHKILLEGKAFPSDHYAIESQIRLKGRKVEESMICIQPREGEDILREEDILKVIEEQGDSIAVIFFSGIQYYTGQLFNIQKITEAGHKKAIGWDLAHAFANVPLYLSDWNVDFACWCTYKYGCSGAGGLAGLFINKRFAHDKRERMLGWWCHKLSSRFVMDNVLDLDVGTSGYRISNPPIFLVTGILGFLKVVENTSMEELREKSLKLTGYLQFLIDNELKKISNKKIKCEIMTPRDHNQRGCQLSLKFNFDIGEVYKTLVKRGIAVDKRYPYVIRVSPVHLYNNFTDVWRFVKALRDSIEELDNVIIKE